MKIPFLSQHVFFLSPIIDQKKTVNYYERLINNPGDIEAHIYIASINHGIGNNDQAFSHYSTAAEILTNDPNLLVDTYKTGECAICLFQEGRILYDAGKTIEAKEIWHRCLEMYAYLIPNEIQRNRNRDVQTIMKYIKREV